MDSIVNFAKQTTTFPQSRMLLDASLVSHVIVTLQDLLISNVPLMESVNVSLELQATNVTAVKQTIGTSQKKLIKAVSHVTVWLRVVREISRAVTLLTAPVNANKMLRARDVTDANLVISILILKMNLVAHPAFAMVTLHNVKKLLIIQKVCLLVISQEDQMTGERKNQANKVYHKQLSVLSKS